MSWLAMSPVEIAAVWSLLAAAAVWLYLLHQRPQQKRVSTLRFWRDLEALAQPRRRRRIREPWALLAQLLFLLLLVLALANPQRGGSAGHGRYIALLLDASVWSQLQPEGQTPWVGRLRSEAIRFVEGLPSGDQVLLLRADADAAPLLPFTADRSALRHAITTLQPSDTVADLPRALELARSAIAGKPHCAIVYIGPGMVDEPQSRRIEELRASLKQAPAASRPQLLVHLIGEGAAIENRGITHLALRRDPAQPDRWHLLTQIRNYGRQEGPVTLTLLVNGRLLQRQSVWLAAGETTGARAEFTWAGGGLLQADISPSDALAADNRAVAHLPVFHPVRVAVFTRDSKALKPVLAANPYLRTEFVAPGAAPTAAPDVAIYDLVAPPAEPATHSIVFRGGERQAGSLSPLRLTGWNPQHPVTRWLKTRDISANSVAPLAAQPTDIVLARTDDGPAILAREEGGRKQLLLGFDPRQSNFPLQPAFPLLLAAAIEWMTGAVEEMADAATTGEVQVPGPASHVFSPGGTEIAFANGEPGLHLLAFQAGLYRVLGPEGERKLAINLPPLPFERWKPAADEAAELEAEGFVDRARDLWPWLVLLAIVPLWLEWLVQGSKFKVRVGNQL